MNQIIPAPGVLSIGIAAHGNVDTTAECLKSLFASVAGDFELLLIDDASPDDMLSLYREAADFHPNTRIYRFPENLEYTHSVNCLLNEAGGERVLFVSNDIFITPQYVACLLEATLDPRIGIARGISNFVDNGLATHHANIDTANVGWEALVDFAAGQYAADGTTLLDDPYLVGDAFIVSRALIDIIGGFDTRYRGYLADVDFGLRAAGAGFRRTLCRGAFAWHVKDANFYYLDDAARAQKYARRLERVAAAWRVFRDIWGLDHLPETWPGIDQVPYAELDELARRRGSSRVGPVSYAQYRVDP